MYGSFFMDIPPLLFEEYRTSTKYIIYQFQYTETVPMKFHFQQNFKILMIHENWFQGNYKIPQLLFVIIKIKYYTRKKINY